MNFRALVPTRRTRSLSLITAATIFAACTTGTGGGVTGGANTGASGGVNSGGAASGGAAAGINVGGTGIIVPPGGAFPPMPIYDSSANPLITEAELMAFADPTNLGGAGVCVFEPHLSDASGPGALFPMNWLRPRFRWTGPAGVTLWEVRFHAASQNTDLVAYTRNSQWILPREHWDVIAAAVYDPITVTIRGMGPGGMVHMKGDFQITKALAGGSMIFWGTSTSAVMPGTSRLYAFTMGDEAVVQVLDAAQSQVTNVTHQNGRHYRGEQAANALAGFTQGQVRCIGCHSVTPRVLGPDLMTPVMYGEGSAVAFTDHYPWNKVMASIDPASPGAIPPYVSPSAQVLMMMPYLGTQTFNKNHWTTGDRVLVTTFGRRSANRIYVDHTSADRMVPLQHDLIWIDLETTAAISAAMPPESCATDDYCGARNAAMEARETQIVAAKGTAWGQLATATGSISNPDFKKSGDAVVYSVSESSEDGHPDWHNNTSDIHMVSYARTGAVGAPVPGASDPAALEYYPAFSPDDQLIAFTRAPAPSNQSRCKQVNKPGDPANCVNSPATLGENPDGPYYNRKGEIYVVGGNGAPIRLRGNDPVSCSGEVSPGVLNSWPKWSSTVRDVDGKKYYFVIFSSARTYTGQFDLPPDPIYTPPISTKSSQLYMSTIEVDAAGVVTTYPAIYLWNQNYLVTGPTTFMPLPTSNLTPAWEDASVPAVPPGVVIPQ